MKNKNAKNRRKNPFLKSCIWYILTPNETIQGNRMENAKKFEQYFSKKENVIEWFGERGIFLEEKKTKGCLHLSKFRWRDGKLFFL